MLNMEVIEPAISPYSAPIVLVKKGDGKVRFCVDYRRLNQRTAFDAEPLPDMDFLFSKCECCLWHFLFVKHETWN